MKTLYALMIWTFILCMVSNCAHVFSELAATDLSGVGSHMVNTSNDLKREREIAISRPVIQQVQQPVGTICSSQLVRNGFYGHYEVMEVCR